MTEDDLKPCFGNLAIPAKLIALLKFEREVSSKQYYSDSFEVYADKKKAGLRTWSQDARFLDSLWCFAMADGSGSMYAFWLVDGANNLETAPILVFGGEGGVHVVARNFDELLQILSFDCAPMVGHDKVSYYRPEDEANSKMNAAFRTWLESEQGLKAIDDAGAIVRNAQQTYGERFRNWFAEFYQG